MSSYGSVELAPTHGDIDAAAAGDPLQKGAMRRAATGLCTGTMLIMAGFVRAHHLRRRQAQDDAVKQPAHICGCITMHYATHLL